MSINLLVYILLLNRVVFVHTWSVDGFRAVRFNMHLPINFLRLGDVCDLWVMNAGGGSQGRRPQPSDGAPWVTTIAEAISSQNGRFNCPFCPQPCCQQRRLCRIVHKCTTAVQNWCIQLFGIRNVQHQCRTVVVYRTVWHLCLVVQHW